MYISPSVIKSIKQNIPIADIISNYTDLEEYKLNQFRCNCLFHQETNPSMYINNNKGFFKCFGCGVSGDVIKFIELIEGINFKQAIQKLANYKNIDIQYSKQQIIRPHNFLNLVHVLRDIEHEQVFNEKLLKKYNHKHRYLMNLGFQEKTLEYFQIGYCFDQNDELYNRITIPWRNSEGELVAVVGRDVTDKKNDKYKAKNGSKKQQHLYNLHNAKYCATEGLILTEDEKSVWRLREFGYHNVIALGSSELGDRKWLLRKSTPRVFLALDNDKAGDEAKKKIIPSLYHLIEIYVIYLPEEYKDIAEITDKTIWEECWNSRKKVVK